MLIAYVDDAGDVQTAPGGDSNVPPVLAFGAVVLRSETLPQLTRDFLALKRKHFGGRMRSRHLLDDVLEEIKGADLKAMVRASHRKRRIAVRFYDELLDLLAAEEARIFGRVWIKGVSAPLDGRAVNTFSIQDMCRTFQHLLDDRGDDGLMVIDSSTPGLNAMVSHSIFTQRFRAAGDQYARLVEMPTFGHSKNHVGLQISDILVSGLITPLAARAYCLGAISGVHVHDRYAHLKERYGGRLRGLQHRFYEGSWRGGYSVSDHIGHKHGGHLFHSACDPCRNEALSVIRDSGPN